MNQTEFVEEVRNHILGYLPTEYANCEVSVQEVTKNNDQLLHGLIIREEGESAVPMIYLEPFFERYQGGQAKETLFQEIADVYMQNLPGKTDIAFPDMSFESLKNNLRVKLVNTSTNIEMLKGMVNKSVECGFSLVPYTDVQLGDNVGGIVYITKVMAKNMDVAEKDIMRAALLGSLMNTEPVLYNIEELMFGKMMGGEPENLLADVKSDDSRSGMMVLTTKNMELGSAALFYPGMQLRISEVLGFRDYYVLPSSVHEVLIIPDNGSFNSKELAQMVKSVNKDMVPIQEQLGDKVLHYRADLGKMSIAVNLEKEKDRGRDR